MEPDFEDAGNPRVRERRPSRELAGAVREGRRVGEALAALDARAANADEDDRALAHELARFLVRRCDERHRGWQVLRQTLLDAGAEVAWDRCERQAYAPTAERVLEDCAGLGRTPMVRVQHAAAQERARAVAPQVDPATTLRRLKLDAPAPPDPETWERALIRAVAARSREQVARRLTAELTG